MKQGIIYKVTNLVNNKIYIGQTIWRLHDRRLRHYQHSKKPKYIFHCAINKYGFDQFKWETIWQGNENMLNKMELYFVDKYKSFYITGYGYNMTEGGDGNKGLYRENNHQYDHTPYTFYHKDGRIEKNITFYNMRKKYFLSASTLREVINNSPSHISIKGWSIESNIYYEHKAKKWSFIHKDGTCEINVTAKYMHETYSLDSSSLSKMCRKLKKYNSVKGWKLYIKIQP